jgi:hypothetical protein
MSEQSSLQDVMTELKDIGRRLSKLENKTLGPNQSVESTGTRSDDATASIARAVTRHLTTDASDPRLGHGSDKDPVPQNEVYLVLSDIERAKGFIRPVRSAYVHTACGAVTRMGTTIAETYARDPHFYGNTYCTNCNKHLPVGGFTWDVDGEVVGS